MKNLNVYKQIQLNKRQLNKLNLQSAHLIGPLIEPLVERQTHTDCQKFKQCSDLIVFVDGGVLYKNLFKNKNSSFSFSIGDGDSLKEILSRQKNESFRKNSTRKKIDDSSYNLDFKLPKNKNESDLNWALQSLPISISTIILVGFFENEIYQLKEKTNQLNENSIFRFDHYMINLGELYSHLKKSKQVKVIWLSNFAVFLNVGLHELSFKGTFSILTFSSVTELKLLGNISYQLKTKTRVKMLSSLTLSNEAQGKFTVETSQPLLVYFSKKV